MTDGPDLDPKLCSRVHHEGHPKAGSQCQLRPIRGGTVCHKHGGAAPQVRAAADRRLQEEQTRADVVLYGLPREVDPGVALLEEVHRTAGHVAWLAAEVGRLTSLTVSGPFGPTKPAVLAQYEAERRHLATVAAAAVRAGVEARQVALAERLGEQLLAAMRGFARDLGHNPDDPAVVAAGVRHLRAVSV